MATMTVGAASLQAIGGFFLKPPARSGAVHRTGAPVLRDSVEAGTFEENFFAVPSPGETDRILRAARKALEAGRRLRREARSGERQLTSLEQLLASLTNGAVRVLEEILTLARLNRGRVFPTYDYLAEATSLGRVTVARALRILDQVGFIVRQRRFKRLDTSGPGPRYEQTSNVYRAFLPTKILAYLPRKLRPAPPPVDEEQRRVERAEDHIAMLSRLDCRRLAFESVADGALAKVLAKLGAAIERNEREFQDDTQTLSESYITELKRADLAGQQNRPDGQPTANRENTQTDRQNDKPGVSATPPQCSLEEASGSVCAPSETCGSHANLGSVLRLNLGEFGLQAVPSS